MKNGFEKNKARGSQVGLKDFQRISILKTRAALANAIKSLADAKPELIWRKNEVASLAGLKSTVPLHAPRNSDLLRTIQQHNDLVCSAALPESKSTKALPADDKLLRKIALLDAEVVSLIAENRDLNNRVARLREQLKQARAVQY